MRDTKERILAQGLNLLSQSGFAEVTVGVLAQRAGMSKSGLFAHFGSKEDAQLQLIDEMGRVTMTTVVQPAMAHPPGLKRLRAIVTNWFGWTERAGLEGGCPVAAGFFEYDDAPADNPVRQRLLHEEARWRAFLVSLANDAVEAGELRADLGLEQFVWELCGIYLNHHVSRRFLRDPKTNDRAKEAFESLVIRSLPSAQTPPRKKRTGALKPN